MGELSLDKRINLSVLVGISLFIIWYFYDAYKALSSIENLILIAPIAGLTLFFCIIEFIRFLREDRKKEDKKEENIKDVLPAMIIFTGYILSLEYLGFDIGTTLFIGVFLKIHGELKWTWIIAYSLLFGFLIPLFFAEMLPYPMPMSILPTDY